MGAGRRTAPSPAGARSGSVGDVPTVTRSVAGRAARPRNAPFWAQQKPNDPEQAVYALWALFSFPAAIDRAALAHFTLTDQPVEQQYSELAADCKVTS